MLVLAIVLGSWLVVAAAVIVLCRGAQLTDQEIEQEETRAEPPVYRLPFAS